MTEDPPTIRSPILRNRSLFFRGRQGRVRLAAISGVVALVALAAFALAVTVGSGSVVVRGVQFQLIEGTTTQGFPWIYPSLTNDTTGFPISVPSGHTFTVTLLVINDDNVNHTLVSAEAAGSFAVTGVDPNLPIGVEGHDDGTLFFTIQVPNANLGSTMAFVTLMIE
ncbi:MAG: hypothetical protein L3K09_08300 [Thermoplasmata archaeon]|nr:hypothetical protein [Thermoplasmata archaeon]